MKKLSRNDLKSIAGGFSCHCGTTYLGEYSSIATCARDCGVFLSPPTNPTTT